MDSNPNLQAGFVDNQASIAGPTNPASQPQYQQPPNPYNPQHNNNVPLQYPMGQYPQIQYPMLPAAPVPFQPQFQPQYQQGYQNPQVPMQQGPVLSLNQNPKMLVGANEIQIMNENSSVRDIETRISSGYCCYTCLVYWELLVALVSLVFSICVGFSAIEVIVSIFGSIVLISACVLALIAKMNYDSGKQHAAFLLFFLSTFLSVLSAILGIVYLMNRTHSVTECETYYGNYCLSYHTYDKADGYDFNAVVTILAIPAQFIIGLALICNASTLSRLMKDREILLVDIKSKSEDSHHVISQL